MKKLIYFAIFEPSTNGTFGVYFPDLPGCVSMGNDYEHAQLMAAEALGLHLWGMEKDNEPIPNPSNPPFENIPNGAIIAPVVVFPDIIKNEMDNKSVKTNISLPSWLKELAEEQGVNFSQLMQIALKEYLGIVKSK